MRIRLAILFVLLTVGCSSSGSWRRVETPHFVLQTDLGSTDARKAGLALESTRDALLSAAWPEYPYDPPKTQVYVLANGLDFERYFGRNTAGLFLHTSPPTVFLYGSADRWELRRSSHRPVTSVLRHELTHELASLPFPHQPKWFAEGLAQFLEVIYYSDDGHSVVVGGENIDAYKAYRAVRRVSLRDALEWNKSLASLGDREALGLYATSWFFVHWLYNEHYDEFRRFEIELAYGTKPSRAFEVAFPRFDPDAADRELFEYQKHGHFQIFEQPLLETKVSMESLHDEVLSPREITELHEVLDEVSQNYLGTRPVKGKQND